MEKSKKKSISSKISFLKRKLTEIKKEIEIIQKDCDHPEKNIKMGEKSYLVSTCAICDKELDMPSRDQVEEYLES